MSTTAGDGSSGDTGEGITISGSVRDGALGLGNPAESVEVRVLMPGPMPPMTTTDASGEFVLDNVPPNQVVFIALAPTPGLALGAIHGIEVTDADVTGLALFRFPQADSTMLEDQLPMEFTLGTGALVGYADTPPVEFVFKPMPPTDSYFAYGMDDSPLINQTVSASTPPAASSFNLDPMPMPGMRTVEAEHVAGGTCTPLTPIAPPILAEHISYVQFDCP